jgi:hypothetical protein
LKFVIFALFYRNIFILLSPVYIYIYMKQTAKIWKISAAENENLANPYMCVFV